MIQRTIILLTLNEISGVTAHRDIIANLSADEILAVDGGSTDGTVELLEEFGVDVYRQKRPGRGAAIREGVAQTSGERIVIFSPDGNEDPQDIDRLFDLLDEGYDVSVASRFLPDSRNEEDDDALPLRKLANQAFTQLANMLWAPAGVRVSDAINGFRGFTRDAFNSMGIQSDRFTVEYEMTQRALRLGLRIGEIPTQEGNRIGGETKAPSIRTGIEFSRFVIGQIIRGT